MHTLKKSLFISFLLILILVFPTGCKKRDPQQQLSQKVDSIMKQMSLSDKVYQMLFVTPESLTKVGTVVSAGEATKTALKSKPVGGIVYFASNFESREQTAEMIKNSQSYSEIPLFIAVDEEGGRVSRLGNNPEMGLTKHPPMKEIGDSKDINKAYMVGKTLATELSELGFNVDFAPVADLIINEENSEIGDRSFGTDAENVSQMVANVVKGLQENQVSAALKHFPGHGSTQVDSHTGFSESTRTLDQIRNAEILPFKAGIKEGSDFVMVSHMTLTNATPSPLPCSLSKEIITDLLKTELGYKGIVITDSFSMGAITEEYTIDEAVVKAITAGVDMILMPKDPAAAHTAILSAVESGKISAERIDESVQKILTLKFKKNMFN